MLTEVEVDGVPVSPGVACSAVCGHVVPLVCTLSNCSSCLLTDVTVEIFSVDPIPTCLTSSDSQSNATDKHAIFDDSVVAVGCLMSSFPEVSLYSAVSLFDIP